MEWSLSNERTEFKKGDKVRMRGDMGGFKLLIKKVHNNHYAACIGYGKERHINLNCLEKIEERGLKHQPTTPSTASIAPQSSTQTVRIKCDKLAVFAPGFVLG